MQSSFSKPSRLLRPCYFSAALSKLCPTTSGKLDCDLIYPDVGSLQAVPFPVFWGGTDVLCAWRYTENKRGLAGGETDIFMIYGRNSQNCE